MSSQATVKKPVAARHRRNGLESGASQVLSELQQVRVVDRGRAAGAEDGHDDGEPDHNLSARPPPSRRRPRSWPSKVAVHAGENATRARLDGVQHQLDAHERDDRVAPDHEHRRVPMVNKIAESTM